MMLMLVRAISDLHGFLPAIEPCDLLLLGGDLCPVNDHSLEAQRNFLDGPFREWLNSVPAKNVVGVAGNHDFIFERAAEMIPKSLRWNYLEDGGVTIEGNHVYGTPWQPWFCDWAFNLYEADLKGKWNLIPAATDILVLHGPPAGYGDLTLHGDRTGSPSLLKRIEVIQPKLVIFGHIHEGRGKWSLGNRPTILANVAHVDERYRPEHAAMTFEI